jgi:hypothetical protein
MLQSLKMATNFLSILDPTTDQFTFQTFDNNKKRKSKTLSTIRHGTIDKHFDYLVNLNNNGAGIYVTVNETNLKGRKASNITSIRGVWIEDDDSLDTTTFPLKPTMQVETSPGRNHYYFLLSKKIPATSVSQKQFKSMMEYSIELGSDPNVKDLPRVLRIPGFFNLAHGKDAVKLKTCTGPRYKWADLLNHFKPTAQTEKPVEPSELGDIDDFLMNAPPARLPVSKLVSALKYIDPDESPRNDVWIAVGMALHWACEGDATRSGYKIFRDWSKQGAKFNDNDWPDIWESFGKAGTSTNPIKLGTIYKMARDRGWPGEETVESQSELDEIRAERLKKLTAFNRYHAIISIAPKTYVVTRGTNEIGHTTSIFHEIRAMGEYYSNEFVTELKLKNGELTPVQTPIFEAWMKWNKRKTYRSLKFLPSKDINLDLKNPKLLPDTKDYNEYLGLQIEPKKGSCKLMKQHLLKVLCNGDQEQGLYVLKWLYWMLQNPGKPPGTCLVFRSRQRAGKNIFFDRIKEAYGDASLMVSDEERLVGQFNYKIYRSIFIIFNEAFSISGNKKKAMNKLKSLIVDEDNETERKFQDNRTVNNNTHLVFLSNENWSAPVEPGDKRYFVVRCSDEKIGDYEYFKTLRSAMRNGELAAFLYEGLNFNLDKFDPREMPRIDSEEKFSNMENTFDDCELFIYNAILNGSFKAQNEFEADIIEHDINEHEEFGKTELYDAYCTFFNANKQKHWNPSPKISGQFFRAMKKILGYNWQSTIRPSIDGDRKYICAVKPINYIKKCFETYIDCVLPETE